MITRFKLLDGLIVSSCILIKIIEILNIPIKSIEKIQAIKKPKSFDLSFLISCKHMIINSGERGSLICYLSI